MGRKELDIYDSKLALKIMILTSQDDLNNFQIANSLHLDHSATRMVVKRLARSRILKENKDKIYSLNKDVIKKKIFDYYFKIFIGHMKPDADHNEKMLANKVSKLQESELFDILVNTHLDSYAALLKERPEDINNNINGFIKEMRNLYEVIRQTFVISVPESEALNRLILPAMPVLFDKTYIFQQHIASKPNLKLTELNTGQFKIENK